MDRSGAGEPDELGTRVLRQAEAHDPVEERRALESVRSGLFGAPFQPVAISRYVLLGPLGAGGVGLVYRAFDPDLDRQVAVKVLRPGSTDSVGDSEARARLLREAQAIAKLSHPNIVAVYDVGTFDERDLGLSDAPEGVDAQSVFMVLELVHGVELSEWLQTEQRDWRQVVSAFVAAGRGLAAAHSRGVVHRDFKPSNVLVGSDGRVRVLDFGLARAEPAQRRIGTPERLAPSISSAIEIDPSTELTEEGTVMGTPAYMAPEQHGGEPVDHAADQYAFCVALYEALCGDKPFTAAALADMYRVKKNGPPPIPSEARVPQFVEAVVMRGLQPDPRSRFPTMDELLDALERDPWRSRKGVLALGAAIAIAAGGIGGGILYREHRVLTACRDTPSAVTDGWSDDRARSVERAFLATDVPYAAATWSRVGAALDLHASAIREQWGEACRATRVHEELSEASFALQTECLSQRATQLGALVAVFEDADVEVVKSAVEAVGELEHVEDCANVERPSYAAATTQSAQTLRETLASVRALVHAGNAGSAVDAASQAVTAAEGTDHPRLLVDALLLYGQALERKGRYEEARSILERTYFEALTRAEDRVAARAATLLVLVEGQRLSHVAVGLRWSEHATALVERLPDADPLLEAGVRHKRGILLRHDGRTREGIDELMQSLSLYEKNLGPEHPRLGHTMSSLGNAFEQVGDYERADEHLRHALEIAETSVSPLHPTYAIRLTNLGVLREREGRNEEALDLFRQALPVFERALGTDHPRTAIAALNVGVALRRLERYEEALAYHEQAVGGFPSDSRNMAWAQNNLGILLTHLDRAGDARRAFERSAAIFERLYGADYYDRAMPLANLGDLAREQGDLTESRSYLEDALAIRIGAKADPLRVASVRFSLAKTLMALPRQRRRALALAHQAKQTYEDVGDIRSEELAEVRQWLQEHR